MRSGPWFVLLFLMEISRAAVAASPRPDDPPAPAPPKPEYRIAIWYDRARPLGTFKYQVYDLRKGEYTRAVDDWLTHLRTRYPGYEAKLRDVVLAREKGATDQLRVGAVLNRELLAAAALEGVFLGVPIANPGGSQPSFALPASPPDRGFTPLPRLMPPVRLDLGPPPPSFPVPMPYPRPHP